MAGARAKAAVTSSIKSVPLDEVMLSALLDRLDEDANVEQSAAGADRRRGARHRYRLKGLIVDIHQPGGTTQSFLVPTRNLGAGGISFLHGGYLHRGTRCTAQLITAYNTWQSAEGTVVSCRYVEGRVHEVGVCFNERIDVESFVPDAVRRHVLLVDDSTAICRLVAAFLKQLNAEVTVAENRQAAVEVASEQVFDVVLMDLSMPVMDGFEALKELRGKGYGGIVVATTARTDAEDRERCLAAGFDGYLAKPFTKEALKALLSGLEQEPLFSSLAGEAEMDELIQAFVKELGAKVRALEEALAGQAWEEVVELARGLKGEAGSYGFEPITEVASQVEESAREEGRSRDLQKQVKELVSLCKSARAPGATP